MKPSAKAQLILVLTIALATVLPLAAGATEPSTPEPAPAAVAAEETSVPALEPAGQCAAELSLFAEPTDDGFLAPEPTAVPVCLVQYCRDTGIRCIYSGTGPHNCCRYSCSADASCAGPDPCPFNACRC